ncbi:hypothetical protein D5F01_LYC04634 [Larimichthys crocea]|uniref:Uncharacterized protein n=1 Tax=Larimichthys crocea TaxID=215358 RepID=A0A6G0IX75_LARCR|nr:hypothetical protein D5F01_LYC04634 [Larimichthys crocea]
MCEQAARYCRDGVHKLLNKEQAKLRAQESREQPKPVAGQDSESATAAQSGNSGAQPGGIDGLVRWIVTKMSDNKNISSREYASSKEEVAVAQEQFFAPEPRRGISVILDQLQSLLHLGVQNNAEQPVVGNVVHLSSERFSLWPLQMAAVSA